MQAFVRFGFAHTAMGDKDLLLLFLSSLLCFYVSAIEIMNLEAKFLGFMGFKKTQN